MADLCANIVAQRDEFGGHRYEVLVMMRGPLGLFTDLPALSSSGLTSEEEAIHACRQRGITDIDIDTTEISDSDTCEESG